MRTWTVLTGIQIPPHILHRDIQFLNTSQQFVIICFTLWTSDNFANLREQHIHSTYSLAIFVLFHIERLDFFRIIGQDNRTFEVLFHQEAFVFWSQIHAPVNREFKLMPFRYRFFQDLDTFCIRQTYKWFLQYPLQTFNQALIKHIVQELHIVITVVQCPLYTVFDEFFCQIHVVIDVIESYFRFNHPELSQMTRCIWIFRTECRSECINCSQSSSSQFTFQLSGNRQTGLFAKEIIIINNRSVFIFLQIIEVHGSNLEHLSGTFTVWCCNQRSVEIEETSFMEELMNRNSHVMTDTEHCTKRIRTRTQVGNLTQELHWMSFFLQWISIVTSTQYFNLTCLNFCCLSGAYRFYQFSIHAQTCTRCNQLQQLFIKIS